MFFAFCAWTKKERDQIARTGLKLNMKRNFHNKDGWMDEWMDGWMTARNY